VTKGAERLFDADRLTGTVEFLKASDRAGPMVVLISGERFQRLSGVDFHTLPSRLRRLAKAFREGLVDIQSHSAVGHEESFSRKGPIVNRRTEQTTAAA
jgi:hypothetical protein